MRFVLLCLLTGCFSTPDLGHYYKCTGVFVCYGDHFGISSSGCAESVEEAEALAYDGILPQLEEAKCGDDWEVVIVCKDTGDRCLEKD